MRSRSTANIPACRTRSCSGCVKLIPKEALQTDQVKGIDDIMADAVAQKFLSAPLTPDQLKELVQIPK